MKKRFGDRAEFLAVYVREAHATDGVRSKANDDAGIEFAQPRTAAARLGVAKTCQEKLKFSIPLVVDAMDDRVGHAYSGMPDRLYLVDRQGRIAYKGGRGPHGFKPAEMEQSLVMLLDESEPKNSPAGKQPGGEKPAAEEPKSRKETPAKKPATAAPARVPPGRLTVLGQDQAWRQLPGAPEKSEPLPNWARMLAGTMPLTTARMLELDALHRSGDRLEARLRGLLRYVAAEANGCAYAQAVAAADLARAGVAEQELRLLLSEPTRLAPPERAALAFARKMMREAHAVTDGEVQELLRAYGEERVVAIVLLLAHASFQDRLLLALQPPAETSGALPPIAARFALPQSRPPSNANPTTATSTTDSTTVPPKQGDGSRKLEADWLALQQNLNQQRGRTGRIRLPSPEEMRKRLGDQHPQAWQSGILWSRVCYGYQPELADAWSACVGAYRQESKQDRVFEQCVFWVITQSLQCYY